MKPGNSWVTAALVFLVAQGSTTLTHFLAVAFLLVALVFIWRSFYRMTIEK